MNKTDVKFLIKLIEESSSYQTKKAKQLNNYFALTIKYIFFKLNIIPTALSENNK
jgi:hypothetical protein